MTFSDQCQKEGPWLIKKSKKRAGKDNIQVTIHQGNGKQRQLKRMPNKGDLLSGSQRQKGVLLYLKNIDTEGNTDEDLSSNIRKYGQSVGIQIMHADVIDNRYCQDVVGSKIRVPVSQKEETLALHIWPEEITYRAWERRERRQHNDNDAQSY